MIPALFQPLLQQFTLFLKGILLQLSLAGFDDLLLDDLLVADLDDLLSYLIDLREDLHLTLLEMFNLPGKLLKEKPSIRLL